MDTWLYRRWTAFCKRQGGIAGFIHRNASGNIDGFHVSFNPRHGRTTFVKVHSKYYYAWLAWQYSQDARYVLMFYLKNFKLFKDAVPTVNVYMDLHGLKPYTLLKTLKRCILENSRKGRLIGKQEIDVFDGFDELKDIVDLMMKAAAATGH